MRSVTGGYFSFVQAIAMSVSSAMLAIFNVLIDIYVLVYSGCKIRKRK
jgi:hypothetical protein